MPFAAGPDRRTAIALFCVAFVTFAWFDDQAGWNQQAQFALTRALVERQTLRVDGYVDPGGDASPGSDGGTYINKPPGLSIAAAVPYAVLYGLERAAGRDTRSLVRANAWIVTMLTAGASGAAIAAVLFLFLRRAAGATSREAAGVALIVAFGTIVFPYSTMFFAQVPAALLVFLAFTRLRERSLAAGAYAGAAVCCFYLCVVAATVFLAACLVHSRRSALRFAAGLLPFAVLLGAYHFVCFGSPWLTAQEASVNFTEPGLVMGILRLPSPAAAWGILGSPYRGLFYCSPVLLAALAGAVTMVRRRLFRFELAVTVATFLAFVAAVASFNGWHGGWAFGPRYLLPVVPLLALPLLFALRAARTVVIALALLSIGIQFLATAVDPMPPGRLRDPIGGYYLPAFLGTDRLPHVGLRGARNAGEFLFGEGSRWSVVPVAIWMLAGSALVCWRREESAVTP